MRRDIKVLTDELKGECGDAIVMLYGWRNSEGATAELKVAKWVKLRVLTLEQAIRHGPALRKWRLGDAVNPDLTDSFGTGVA